MLISRLNNTVFIQRLVFFTLFLAGIIQSNGVFASNKRQSDSSVMRVAQLDERAAAARERAKAARQARGEQQPQPQQPQQQQPPQSPPAQPASQPGVGGGATSWEQVKDADGMDINIDFKRPPPGSRFSFNLIDADLIELVKIIGNITGRSFIIGGNVPKIKATIYAPAKITAQEAYHTFLSVLQVNGLTVIPSGRYLKVVPVQNITAQKTPVYLHEIPDRDQIITRLQPMEYVSAEELSGLLSKFKSPEGDISVYAPSNTLIITDYGSSIRRLMRLITILDVPGSHEQIYVEPINYAAATEIAARIQEIFDINQRTTGQAPAPRAPRRGQQPPQQQATTEASSPALHQSRVIPDDRTNSLIIIASEEGYLRILELIRVLDVQVAGDGTIHVRRLQHANAEEMSTTLSNLTRMTRAAAGKQAQAAGGDVSLFEGDMQISADKATNSLVIVSSLRDYMSLKTVIDELDSIKKQVFVEAVIMEVSLDKDKQLGLGVHGGKLIGGEDKSLLYAMSKHEGGPSSLTPSVLATGLAAGVRGPDIPGSADMVGISVPGFGVALQALQRNTDVNVLSTPHIMALDNTQATITVGENVPVLQGVNSNAALLGSLAGGAGGAAGSLASLSNTALSGFNSYSRQDVGISLSITPNINDDNQVRLEIDLEISEVKSADESGPTISKQNAQTTSVVGDQQTFVLGGLITDNQVETTYKVPFLGDIPLVGMLFRRKRSITKKRNLIIFLTPYIIRSSDDFRDIFERKMAERREFIERYTAFEYHRYEPHLDWSRTKGAFSVINEVIGQAEEDHKLKQQSVRRIMDDHSPKPPIDFSKTIEEDDIIIEHTGGISE